MTVGQGEMMGLLKLAKSNQVRIVYRRQVPD